MTRDYMIAGLGVRLESDIDIFYDWCEAYESHDIDIDMTIRVTLLDSVNVAGKCVLDRDTVRVYEEDGYTTAYYYAGGECYGAMRYDEGYIHTEAMLIRGIGLGDLDTLDIGYMMLGTLFNYRLTYVEGLALHGSCIAYNGSGIIFTAPSGVGKSTQARLWYELLGEAVVTVNDDKPALRKAEGEILCYGTPFAGKDHLNANISAPLRAIVNVVRGTENRIERLSRRDAVVLLFEETQRSMLSRRTNMNSMNVINDIIENVPIFRLYCTPTTDAVKVTLDEIREVL